MASRLRGLFTADPVELQGNDGGDRFREACERPPVVHVKDTPGLQIGEGLPAGAWFPAPAELPDQRDEIEATGLVTDTKTRRFGWEIGYMADEYIRLPDTFSGHSAMAQWQRGRFYGEIRRRLAERPDGPARRPQARRRVARRPPSRPGRLAL